MKCLIPANDLSQKLHSSVCMYEGRPVWVRITERGLINISDLPGRNNERTIDPRDEKFDISSPPLGYMQRDNMKVLYLSRAPIRRSRQSLDERSLIARNLPVITPNKKRRVEAPATRAGSNGALFFTQSFVDMVMGDYPHVENIIKGLRGKHKSNDEGVYEAAVNRIIALSINPLGIINVFLKNDLIGWIPPDSMEVQVKSSDRGWYISRYLSHGLSWKVN